MPKLINEKREYQRLLHSEKEQKQLASKGFEAVYSSNVSAIARDGVNLLIRFHGGATYSYRNKGKDYDRIMGAASKGKWVWRFLIRPNVPYNRVSGVIIKNDVPSRDMMEEPREPKFKVEAIVPEDYWTTGNLPQIRIVPLNQATTMLSSGNENAIKKALTPTIVDRIVKKEVVKDFKPAKTIEEANEFTKQWTDNGDLTGIKIKRANYINSQMDRLTKEYPMSKKYDKFGSGVFNTKAIAAANDNGMGFNTRRINGKSIYEAQQRHELNLKQLEKSLEKTQARLDIVLQDENINNASKQTRIRIFENSIEKTKKELRHKRWFTANGETDEEVVKKIVTHEYGHTLDKQYMVNFEKNNIELLDRLNENDREKSKELRVKASNLRKTSSSNYLKAYKDESIYRVSEYGSTKEEEYLAETFVMYNDEKERKKLPDYTVKLFDDLREFIKEIGELNASR